MRTKQRSFFFFTKKGGRACSFNFQLTAADQSLDSRRLLFPFWVFASTSMPHKPRPKKATKQKQCGQRCCVIFLLCTTRPSRCTFWHVLPRWILNKPWPRIAGSLVHKGYCFLLDDHLLIGFFIIFHYFPYFEMRTEEAAQWRPFYLYSFFIGKRDVCKGKRGSLSSG